MKRSDWWLLGLMGAAALYLYLNRQQAGASLQSAEDVVVASLAGWKNVETGPQWVPYLNQVEAQMGLPPDLLARVAYQESSFKDAVIRGTQRSSAGALGMMQMLPQYFASVNVPTPFTDADVQAQIQESAQQLLTLYNDTGSWSLALAAYNAGLGNVQKYGGIPPFPETQNYVANITADVPAIAGAA